jgi:hypothetical protein
MWLVLWQPRKTVAEKGVESVQIEISGDPKAGFTLIDPITASGQRLPLLLIAKGLTPKCQKEFGKNFTLIEGTTERQLDECVKEIESLPDSENEHKKNQLKWFSILNCVVSSDAAFKDNFTRPTERLPWFDENVEGLEDIMISLKRQIESREVGDTKEAARFDHFIVDLTYVDVSVVIREPNVPNSTPE